MTFTKQTRTSISQAYNYIIGSRNNHKKNSSVNYGARRTTLPKCEIEMIEKHRANRVKTNSNPR
jgi:hypothetical protein